jgi:thiol-disulfide isomerase/thioredoxin
MSKRLGGLSAGVFSLCLLSQAVWAVKENEVAPAVVMPSLKDASTIDLSQLRGKVVLLDFWASWCGPCRKSLPLYNDLRKNFAGQPFEIVAVSVDASKEDALGFLQKHALDYLVGWDASAKLAETYAVPGMPSSYVISPEGVVKHVHKGFHEGEIDKLKQEIQALLPKKM